METEVRFNRLKDAPWFPKEGEQIEVIVGGAGGIGSWVTMLLGRAGFDPHVYDFDRYEEHNMAGQLCRVKDVGKFKVDALKETVREYCGGQEIITYNEMVDTTTPTHKFILTGFDNIKAREDMFQSWFLQYRDDPTAIFIDGRLNAEQLQIFCVRGGDHENIKNYRENQLFPDSDVPDAPCTFKQTSHAATMIASHMVAFFCNHITNVYNPDSGRVIPFEWEYYLAVDMLISS